MDEPQKRVSECAKEARVRSIRLR
ncbi:uncharacterized protein G2W53_002762 [Senna tora]|uniref:Uncharacterized protein n=1 Tax=Senna tora TaxID=362788 RepID=A0A835CFP9_9FABA|nr:uncharacterized protein G2W53_002762 [Senna tora]